MRRFNLSPALTLAAAVLLLSTVGAQGQSYMDLMDEVQEFKLDNGITFLVLERHDVPVFTFNTYMNVGSSDEVTGITGLAHILEHMAFKGTDEIGTKDIKKERKAMQAEDEAYLAWKAEFIKGDAADPDKLAALRETFDAAADAAREFVVSNEFGQIIENNGGKGMNAGTWTDNTNYFYSFPSNRLELWAYLEGTRMGRPVFREFYTEKDGPVTEERRMRVDNSPFGMILMEKFQNLVFTAHPYHHSTIGWMSDLNTVTRQDCEDFYNSLYVGKNMTVAVVGDVEFDEVKKLAEKYFKHVSDAEPKVMETVEPEQLGERRQVIQHTAQPLYAVGYHIGNYAHPDAPVYQALADILGQGRTSRLHKRLVNEEKKAINVFAMSGFPDDKYPSAMGIMGMPAKDITALELEELIFEEIEKLKTDGVTEAELAGVKRRTKANFIRGLRGNGGLARQLSYFQGKTGDWRNMFKQIDEIEAVTVDDVKRVANEIFVPNNRSVIYIETVEEES